MRGHIERRGQRSWRLKWELGTNIANGKRQTRRKTVTRTKREAESELARILGSLTGGTYVDPNRMTVRELVERWRDDVAAAEVSPKTFERYRERVGRLIEGLGSIPLLRLQPLQIQAFYTTLRESGHRRTGSRLSEQTMLHFHKVLVAALAQGVRWRLVAVNAARQVNAPVPKRIEMATLGAKQMRQLLKCAEHTYLHVPVLLWLTAGLRRGELLALRWADLDRERCRLAVVRTLEETKAGVTFKAPKTARSTRVIPLPPVSIELLAEHGVRQKRRRLTLGAGWQNQGLIFPDSTGAPMRPRNVTKAFTALAMRAGLPNISIHSLRHTHATELLRAGVHPKVVSERVGHSSIAFTLQRYGHALPDMQQNAADEAERLVGSLVRR